MRRIRTVVAMVAAILIVVVAALAALTADRGPRPIRIMALGDSITDGAGSSTGAGYRTDLGHRLAAAGHRVDFVGSLRSGPGPDPEHEGHRGWRIDQIAAGVDGWLATYQPDVVLLHLGTNDLNQDYRSASAPQRLGALLDQILIDRPLATIVLAQLVPSTLPAVQARIVAFNAALPAIAAARGSRVRVVDLSGLSTADLHDALHPNDRGYARMAVGWSEALELVLARDPQMPGDQGIRRGLRSGSATDPLINTGVTGS